MTWWILLIALSTSNKSRCWEGAVVNQSNVDRAYWTVCMTWSSTKYFCYQPTYQWNLHIFSCDFRTNVSQFMLTFAIFDWYRNFCTVNLNVDGEFQERDGWMILTQEEWMSQVVEKFYFVFLYECLMICDYLLIIAGNLLYWWMNYAIILFLNQFSSSSLMAFLPFFETAFYAFIFCFKIFMIIPPHFTSNLKLKYFKAQYSWIQVPYLNWTFFGLNNL